MTGPARAQHRQATLHEIREMVGDLEATKLEAILATEATPAQLEEALAWVAGESDVMGDLERPLAGPVAAVYEILMSEAPADDRD